VKNPTAREIDTAMVHIDFTASLLEVSSIDGGSAVGSPFTIDLAGPDWNNTEGWIDYDSGLLGSTTTETDFVVATIHMKSKSASGLATLEFVKDSGDPDYDMETGILKAGPDYLNWTMVVNGTVKVGPPVLTVYVAPADKGDVTINGVTPSSYPNTTTWSLDEVVNLTAVNSVPNWTFTEWSGDLTGGDNTTNITMDWDKNVTAHFAPEGTTATLEGHVGLQGLPATNVTVRFFAPNTTTENVTMKTHTITDSSGNFTIGNLTPGSYDVAVKGSTSLSNLESGVNLTGGNTTPCDFGVLLEGDANDDDWADFDDRILLYQCWNAQQGGGGGYESCCDFNRDGWDDFDDRILLYGNWNQHGDLV